jgi:hypothetical protein
MSILCKYFFALLVDKGHNSVTDMLVPLCLLCVRAPPEVGFINLKTASVLILLLWKPGIVYHVNLNGVVLDCEACFC